MKRHAHETTVLGLFKKAQEADHAVQALTPMGYGPEDISLVATRDAYEREELVQFVAEDKLHEESVRAGKIGGLTGAILAGATAITAALSGGASLLATGPLIAVITGAGGIFGGLLGAGFSEEEANKVDHALAQGEVLVIVHAENRKLAEQAKATFQLEGADMIHIHH